VYTDTAQTRTLQRALEVVGTVERLAGLLGAQRSDLISWLCGASQTPSEVYLRALDVVAEAHRFKAQKT
jgi:DNA-binding transcriptional regulator YdaS (Cro superfamily)